MDAGRFDHRGDRHRRAAAALAVPAAGAARRDRHRPRGGLGENSSGDITLAFSTAPFWPADLAPADLAAPLTPQTLGNAALTPLFEAVADATEEAIINALCAATTTTGINGRVAHALPHDLLREAMARL
jgi:D-aminopeptidase